MGTYCVDREQRVNDLKTTEAVKQGLHYRAVI